MLCTETPCFYHLSNIFIMSYIARFFCFLWSFLSAFSVLQAQCPNPPVANAGPDVTLTCVTPSVTLVGNSNVPATTYAWTGPGGYTSVLQNPVVTQPGIYTLTVQDANGCTDTDEVAVFLDTAVPALSIAPPPTLNCAQTTVLLSVTSSAQTIYFWTGPNGYATTIQNPAVNIPGTYTVVATSPNGCTAQASVTVVQDIAPPGVSIVRLPGNGCLGIFQANSPTPGVSYQWSGAGSVTNQRTLTPLVPGTYSVIVTAPNACTSTATVAVSTVPAVQMPANVTLCDGDLLNVNFQGSAGANFDWTSSNPAVGLPASGSGNIRRTLFSATGNEETSVLIVTPSYTGCAGAPQTFTVTVRPRPRAAISGGFWACAGESITLTASGGTRYQWNNGTTTAANTVTPQTAATYTVTVTAANGCTAVRDIVIGRGLDVSGVGSPICNPTLNNASIDITIRNGNSPFNYLWSNGSTQEDLNNLTPGSYTVTVRDANNCTGVLRMSVDTIPGLQYSTISECNLRDRDTIFIPRDGHPYQLDWSHWPGVNDPPYPGKVPAGTYRLLITARNGCSVTRTLTVTPGTSLSVTTTPVATSCFGSTDGRINATVSGGNAPYTYQWSHGFMTSQNVVGLSAGTYTVTVTEGNGCTVATSTVVTQPDPIVVQITSAANCFVSTASGGTPPYTYLWSNFSTTPTVCPAQPGTYTVTVTDANSCTVTGSRNLTGPVPLTGSLTVANVRCFGESNGSITATAAGGTPPYNYNWSAGRSTNLPAGSYTVTITDATGTTTTASAVVTQPTELRILPAVTNVSCFGGNNGSITLTVFGGTPGYTYQWSPTGAPIQNISATAGTYTAIVTDANACTASASATVTQPPAIVVNVSINQSSCTGEANTVAANASGVNPPFAYLWSDGRTGTNLVNLPVGSYTLTVRDNNVCTTTATVIVGPVPDLRIVASGLCTTTVSVKAEVSASSQPYTFDWAHLPGTNDPPALNNVLPGTYTVTATAFNGCSQTKSIVVPNASSPPSVALTPAWVSCFGGNDGTITSTVTGGAPPFSYNWGTGATTDRLVNLRAGTYAVTVTDANGCTATATSTVYEPSRIIVTTTVTSVKCNGGFDGNISAVVTGGASPYLYTWSNGNVNKNLTNVAAGTYVVTVTDANGCTGTSASTVTQPAPIVTAVNITPIPCNGTTGGISVSATGGVFPYTFHWNNGATGAQISTVAAGTYTVTITDNNGCTKTETATLNISLPLQVTPLFCDSLTTLNVLDGVPPFIFRWDDGFTGQTRSLPPGTYQVTVTGNNGCSKVHSVWVSPNPLPCTRIEGNMRFDNNKNCLADAGEPGISGRLIRAEGTNGDVFLAQTAMDGSYVLRVVPGTYRVMTLLPPNSGQLICRNDTIVALPVQGNTARVDYAIKNIPQCPKMTVDINTTWMRRCFGGNNYAVKCCNTGTVTATNAYVDVRLDPFLIFENATRSGTSLGDNVYRFLLGNVLPGQCISFNIIFKVSCDATLGQTHCSEAHIYPDTSCAAPNPQWKGGQVVVGARCAGDSLRFTLKNIGKGALSQNLEYIVIEDGIMARSGQAPTLGAGDSMIVALRTNGRTWRLETKQEPFAPGAARPALSVEGCRVSGPFSTGFVTKFPVAVNGPWQDIDCNINRGSYDPNDKEGMPVGFGVKHYIEPETELTYRIRFQNTGTDTAFNIVIRDTLSKWIDPASVVPGTSSHPYTFELTGRDVLVFSFANIMLPDSNINQEQSNGFVTYAARPRATVPLETDIFNRAAIYFDFNDPIFTNTTVHRVGRNFVTVRLWEPAKPAYKVWVVPQPMSDMAQIWVEKAPPTGDYLLQVFDMQGVLVRTVSNTVPRFDLQRDALPEGMYMFQIRCAGALTGSGKLIVAH